MRPQIERYEILEELGQGGMSVVYRAFDQKLKRPVALKVLHSFLANKPDARERLQREAMAVAKLHHPGIVEIYDASSPEATPAYLVTELVEGTTLRAFIERLGGLRHPELAMLIGRELALALSHAHENGVVHRDLKPENVMVTKGGSLKLMDFGIAQIADLARVTATGTLLGSPAHMAPEVIDGHRPSSASDLFSLGTILYWLAVGRLPFEGENPSALFRKILDGAYDDPQMAEPKIGNGLARLIRSLLETKPSERPESARKVADSLEQELALVGLVPAELELRHFLTNADRFMLDLRDRLVPRLIELGKSAAEERAFAKATDCFNRVLALEPEHAEVRALARSVGRRGLSRRATRIAAGTVIVGAFGAAVAVFVVRSWTDESEAPAANLRPIRVAQAEPKRPAPAAPQLEVKASPMVVAEAPKPIPHEHSPSRSVRAPKIEPVPVLPPPPPTVVEAKASEVPLESVTKASLRVRIGGSFADVWLDGKLVSEHAFQTTLTLEPGVHEVVVRKPGLGFFKARSFEVKANGSVVENLDGSSTAVRSELIYPVPRPGQAAPEGWSFEAPTETEE